MSQCPYNLDRACPTPPAPSALEKELAAYLAADYVTLGEQPEIQPKQVAKRNSTPNS